jgi:type II secretory pathway component PulM
MTGLITSYWRRLSVREQGLVLGASLLMGCVLGWFAVVQPLLAWRDRARAAYVDSATSHYDLASGIARLQELQTSQAGSPQGEREPVRSVVAGAASRAGIVLSRVLPDEAGRLNVWIEAVDPATLMGWLETLSREHGVVVVRAGIEQSGSGELRAQLLLARSGA